MNQNISIKAFYDYCKQEIIENPELYNECLNRINNYEVYEQKGEPIIIKSWINTIDSIDISMLLTETNDVLNKIANLKDNISYLVLLTEITIILNNIFYSNYKSYKPFWKNNTNNLYYSLVWNFKQLNNISEIKKVSTNIISLDDYYHTFFLIFQEKCLKLSITIDFEEYYL